MLPKQTLYAAHIFVVARLGGTLDDLIAAPPSIALTPAPPCLETTIRRHDPARTAVNRTCSRPHRLSRSGDRAANSALYIVAITRMRHHQPTRAYFERRTAEGLTKREIIRCLKRFIAREVFHALPRGSDPALMAA